MRFDTVITLDWSAAGTPKTGKDSIWIGIAEAGSIRTENIATRAAAERRLADLLDRHLATEGRLLLAADFAFGAPAGFTQAVTGRPDALSLWAWLADKVQDDERNRTNYRDVAGQMNGLFEGGGPFWGNGAKVDIPGLPRTKPNHPAGLPEHRQAEIMGRESGLWPKTLWQLAGAGAVGAQSLTGMPVLERLRRRTPGHIAVWPIDAAAATAPIVMAETYLSLLGPQVKADMARGMVQDAAQVSRHAEAFLILSQRDQLARLFDPSVPSEVLAQEGWYLGAGQAALVQSAFQDL
jgi:molybdopterin molybdotransferase